MKKWLLVWLILGLLLLVGCSKIQIPSGETNSAISAVDTPLISPTASSFESVTPSSESLPTQTPELMPSPTPQTGNDEVSNYNAIIIAFSINNEVQRGILLGCSKDEMWLTQDDFELPTKFTYGSPVEIKYVNGGELYHFYSNKQLVTSEEGTEPKMFVNSGDGKTILDVEFKPFTLNEMCVIGITGDWNALPRTIKKQDDSNFSVDIDGDSEEEYCSLDKTPDSKYPNNYNIALTISKNDKVITETELLKAVSTDSQYDVFTMDVNGDGILEIISVLRGSSYLEANVYEYKGNSANEVLSTYIGD